MDQKMVLMGFAAALVLIAIYLALSGASKPEAVVPTPNAPDTKAAELILGKGIAFGSGLKDYSYSYSEASDGYKVSYILTKFGNESEARILNPLSTKDIYFMDNETILCIQYGTSQACSSVGARDDMKNYLDSIRADYFNDSNIMKFQSQMAFLLNKGYLTIDPKINDRTVNGRSCKEISYVIDFNNATVSDAAVFGVGASSPKVFRWKMCVDNSSGNVLEKSFSYELNGAPHTYDYSLGELKMGGINMISAPGNLSASSDDAVAILINEKQQQIVLANCFTTMGGDALDKCVADMALQMQRTDLCAYAGARQDRCLVSIVPLKKDEGICALVSDLSYKDDCFIELAGAFKNNTFCQRVLNQSKMGSCTKAATPVAANQTSNQSINAHPPVTPEELINYIDKANSSTEGPTQVGNMTNGTG